jgi:enediyne polyketide synthase
MHVPDEVNAGPVQAAAIVGAALRFPGASDPSGFHELTVSGRRMFRPTATGGQPRVTDRGDQAARGHSALAARLDDEARGFGRDDDLTGGITARHVLAAETAAAALADIPPVGRAVAPERIGVFIADIPEPGTADVRAWVHQQLQVLTPGTQAVPRARRRDSLVRRAPVPRPAGAGIHEFFLGAIGAVRPARDAALNGVVNGTTVINGPVPGGLHCSLRAVAEACEALNAGAFDLVLAGGVAIGTGGWPRGPAGGGWGDEHIRVYDLSPTGPLPGEGCGIVALTRAADARVREVPAYAEIAGWHYASDGVPEQAVLPAAYLRAAIDPADIQFVEGHGAATAAEDQAELSALLAVLGPRADSAGNRCALGSVSANIGDTGAAAGVAALLKTAFAMTADVLPPSTGCVRPNRLLSGDTAPFRLPPAPELWPQTPVQLAAVNTLGTAPSPDAPRSGPAHLVLRRARDLTRRPGRHRKPSPLISPALPVDFPRQA